MQALCFIMPGRSTLPKPRPWLLPIRGSPPTFATPSRAPTWTGASTSTGSRAWSRIERPLAPPERHLRSGGTSTPENPKLDSGATSCGLFRYVSQPLNQPHPGIARENRPRWMPPPRNSSTLSWFNFETIPCNTCNLKLIQVLYFHYKIALLHIAI